MTSAVAESLSSAAGWVIGARGGYTKPATREIGERARAASARAAVAPSGGRGRRARLRHDAGRRRRGGGRPRRGSACGALRLTHVGRAAPDRVRAGDRGGRIGPLRLLVFAPTGRAAPLDDDDPFRVPVARQAPAELRGNQRVIRLRFRRLLSAADTRLPVTHLSD